MARPRRSTPSPTHCRTISRPSRRCSARSSSTTTSTTASPPSSRPAHFFDPVHARIFEVAAERIRRNALATPVTIKAFFEEDAGLNELGGPAYLVRLAGAAISLFAARDYAQLIYDLAIRRELILIGQDISQKAARIEVDSEAEGPDRRGRAGALPARRAGQGRPRLPDLPPRRHRRGQGRQRRLRARRRPRRPLHRPRRPRQAPRRPAPLRSLILAGRPSMGKTSLATNIAFNIARAYKKGTRPDGSRRRGRRRRRRLLLAGDVRRAARRPHPLRGLAASPRTKSATAT